MLLPQFRHPDATPNAYSVFGFAVILIFMEALILYFDNWLSFGIFLFVYLLTVLFIAVDTYYVGVGRSSLKVTFEISKLFCCCLCRKPKVLTF